jgi:hypothetical protein
VKNLLLLRSVSTTLCFLKIFKNFIIDLFTCAYIVWVISPAYAPQFQAGPVLPLSLVLLKKRDKPNREDKVFLLVELRIAIQKYS